MAINITLPQTPGANSVLVAVVSLTDSGGLAQVTSIVQSGATWQRAVQGDSGDERVEIWWSGDAEGASTSILINTQADENETAIVVEYSGLSVFQGSAVDQTAVDSGISATASSGTTSTTTNADELSVAAFAIRGGSTVSSPTNGYTLQQQTATGAGGTDVAAAFATLALTALGTTDTDVTIDGGSTDWGGAVATFFGNLLAVTAVSPEIIPADGGHKLTLTGKFDLEREYNAHVGPAATVDDPVGYLPSGNGDAITPISATELEFYSPELLSGAGNLVDIFVTEDGNPTQTALLGDRLALVDPDLKSLAFQMRKNFPPKYRLGPRNLDVLPRVATVKNHLLWSEDFSNAVWVKLNASVIGSQADPFGGTDAFILHEDTATGEHRVRQNALAVVPGETYTYSVYLKEDGRQWAFLSLFPDVNFPSGAWFDLGTGTLGVMGSPGSPFTPLVHRIRSVGNGWYRCSITFKVLSGDSVVGVTVNATTGDGVSSYTGTDQDSLVMAFADFDVWSVERAYVMTGATPVT